jgi:hypothetical protein
MGIDIGSIINLNPLPKSGGFLFGEVFISYEPTRRNIKNQRGDGNG